MLKKIAIKYHSLSDNNKIVLRNVFGAFFIKGLSLIVSLFTMPAYMKFFHGEAVLGLWYTILSVLTWILNFDLGIGNGLRNHLAAALAQKDYEQSRKLLSSSYLAVGGICVVITLVFVSIFGFINWNAVFNIDQTILSENALLLTVKIVFVGIMLQMFFKLITSVLYAMQKSSVNNCLSLVTSLLIIASVSVIPSQDNDRNMIVMAVVHAVAVLLPLLVASTLVFSKSCLKKCIPSVKYFSKNHAKEVLSLGGTFLIVQILYMLIMNTNEYLITFLHSNEAVVEYQIYYKFFSLGGILFNLAMTPIWSAVTKAFVENNISWIRKLNRKLMACAALGTVFEFLLIPFLQIFVNLWLGDRAVSVNFWYEIPFALLGGLLMFNGALSSIANGIGRLRTQMVFFGIGAVIKVPIAWALVKYTGLWIAIVWANAIALLGYCIAQPIMIRNYIGKK